ncbi:hypothetical protein N7472_002540 [Penicillium cf. griseofulvum]|uniref:Uncharacterized protein n=1 Tax=Penicillium cf. griseofulvum TaxID=2972120 RepID=A0A9W9MRM1_9EURO|nr:hypothetical protein N7472_002540 [Penicillium cf. griseofulvum]
MARVLPLSKATRCLWLPPYFFFFFHSEYMLHHGAGYTRLHQSDGVWAGNKAIQSGYDQLLLFSYSRSPLL